MREIASEFCCLTLNTGRILEFSESLGPNDLAFWLFQELGNDYKEDIEKLKGQTNHKSVSYVPAKFINL